MFTGIITDIGQLTDIKQDGDTQLTLHTRYDVTTIALGASIACDGVCLTVTGKGTTDKGKLPGWFTVDASAETLRCTTLGAWKTGTPVNLERALAVGDELGGHFVTGHVDGTGEIASIEPIQDSHTIAIHAPERLLPLIAPKGAITLNGVSLTVNRVQDNTVEINLIPHTWQHTTFSAKQAGDVINIEIDMLARYMARLLETQKNETA